MIADGAFAGVMLEGAGVRNSVAVRGDGFGDVSVEYFGDVLGGVAGWNDFGELDLLGVGPAFAARAVRGFLSRLGFGAFPRWFAQRKDDLGGLGFRRLGGLIGGRSERCEGGGQWVRGGGPEVREFRLRPADARELVAPLGLVRRGCGLHRGDFAGWLARNDRREIFENVSCFFLPNHGSRRSEEEQLYERTEAVQKWGSAST
jgi:hypothetical protein